MRTRRYFLGALLALSGAASLGAQAGTGTIRGKVTIDGSAQPISGATVSFGSRSVQTREDGGEVAGLSDWNVRWVGPQGYKGMVAKQLQKFRQQQKEEATDD